MSQEAEARAKMDTLKARYGMGMAVAKRLLGPGAHQHQPVIRTPGLRVRTLSKLKVSKKCSNLLSKTVVL